MNIEAIVSSTIVCTKTYQNRIVKIISFIFNNNKLSKQDKIHRIKTSLDLRYNATEGIIKKLF
jgi:hypothetical protein